MINTASLFSQLLRYFPRQEFQGLVRKHNADSHSKGFDCWTQFVAMTFCQRVADQSSRIRSHHNCRYLQGSLANRTVFQGTQTEP